MNEYEEILKVLKVCSNLFFEHYGYVYNVIISYSQKKPVGPLLEIEKAFAHLMQSVIDFEKGNRKRGERNLDRFRGHIERMLLDMYKIAFLLLIEEAKSFARNCKNVRATIEIEKLYKESRDFEMENIGSTIGDSSPLKEKILKNYKKNLARAEKIITKEEV